jgi:hypothetical protein
MLEAAAQAIGYLHPSQICLISATPTRDDSTNDQQYSYSSHF